MGRTTVDAAARGLAHDLSAEQPLAALALVRRTEQVAVDDLEIEELDERWQWFPHSDQPMGVPTRNRYGGPHGARPLARPADPASPRARHRVRGMERRRRCRHVGRGVPRRPVGRHTRRLDRRRGVLRLHRDPAGSRSTSSTGADRGRTISASRTSPAPISTSSSCSASAARWRTFYSRSRKPRRSTSVRSSPSARRGSAPHPAHPVMGSSSDTEPLSSPVLATRAPRASRGCCTVCRDAGLVGVHHRGPPTSRRAHRRPPALVRRVADMLGAEIDVDDLPSPRSPTSSSSTSW